MDIDQLSGLALDEAISVEVFKHKLLGSTTCYFAEGSWGVAPDTNPDGWMCYADTRPVYVDTCHCEPDGPKVDLEIYKTEEDRARYMRRYTFAGHETICLTPVDTYSESWGSAMGVVRHMKPYSLSMLYLDDRWIVEMHDAITRFKAEVICEQFDESGLATAICRAALKFVRKIGYQQ